MINIIKDADGKHWVDGKEFRPDGVQLYRKKTLTKAVRMTESFVVDTLEGTMEGQAGDWLMIGVDGEMYPCEAKIFTKTYELASPKEDQAEQGQAAEDDNLDAHPGFF